MPFTGAESANMDQGSTWNTSGIENRAFDNNEKERGSGSDVRNNRSNPEIPTYSSIFHIPCDNSPPPPYQSTNPYTGVLPSTHKQNLGRYNEGQDKGCERVKLKKNKFTRFCKLKFINNSDLKSTAERSHQSSAKTIKIVLSLTILLFLAVIVVVLYLTVGGGLVFSEEYEESPIGIHILPNKPIEIAASRVVSGMFRVKNLQFNEELRNKSSPTFFYLSKDVTYALNKLFKSSFISNEYNGSEIISFRKGSVVVDCRIYLRRSSMKVAVKVGMAFIDSLENVAGQMLLDTRFDIDVQSIMFTATTAPKENKSYDNEASFAHSSYQEPGWSQWSAWSSCINYVSYGSRPRCDPTLKSNRVRVCRQNGGAGRLMKDDGLCETLPTGIGSFPMQEKQCECNEEFDEQNISRESSLSKNYTESKRKCSECFEGEVCISIGGDPMATCRTIIDPEDPTGCGGLCANHSLCRPLTGTTAYQCIPEQPRCALDEFQCKNNGSICIRQSQACDGQVNCLPDASDEQNCPNHESEEILNSKSNCESGHFRCDSGDCINDIHFCDGLADCGDSSDEPRGCDISCMVTPKKERCSNGRCIFGTMLCDGNDDCGDNSDENNCDHLIPTES